jgi:hypothetical protein
MSCALSTLPCAVKMRGNPSDLHAPPYKVVNHAGSFSDIRPAEENIAQAEWGTQRTEMWAAKFTALSSYMKVAMSCLWEVHEIKTW